MATIQENKHPLLSKTIWVGGLAVLIGVLQFVSGQVSTGSEVTLMGILMVALRLVTSQAVALN